MSFTPYNAPLLGSLLGDHEAASRFGVQADIKAMLEFEIALANAQSDIGMISSEAAQSIASALSSYEADIKALSQSSAIDGMAVPGLIQTLRDLLPEEHKPSLHLGSTSQDVIDTSAMMRMKSCMKILLNRLTELDNALQQVHAKNASNAFMAYTRMQAALPSRAGERINAWLNPLKTSQAKSAFLQFPVQLGGPIASSEAYDGNRAVLTVNIASRLEIDASDHVWHSDRSVIVEIGNWLSILSGHLGKMGTDICLMAQMGERQIKLNGGGTSSAMAHKQNPVLAETLVTIAKFNALQASGLHHSLLHEQERSGSAWMLEWMIMPQLFVTTAAALRNATHLVASIEQIGEPS
jgi:3-carboxy-cis,cis-muconate cycloisomerase